MVEQPHKATVEVTEEATEVDRHSSRFQCLHNNQQLYLACDL